MTHHDIILTHSVATNTCVSAERIRSLLERSREDKYSPKSDRPNMEAEPFSQLFLDEKKSA